MTAQLSNPLQAFQWDRQPDAFRYVNELVDAFIAECPAAAKLAQRMRDETGTRFYDWVGHIQLNRRDPRLRDLNAVGYTAQKDYKTFAVFSHDGGIFPTIVVTDGHFEIGIKAELVADYLAANNLDVPIEGGPLADVRLAKVCTCGQNSLVVIERHGDNTFEYLANGPSKLEADAQRKLLRLHHLERLRMRKRDFETDEEGFAHANKIIDDSIADLGVHLTCDLFFRAEREYWQRRNRAAQVQYARQEKLGLGWGNHDHHTYRCSRKNFHLLVATWEKLGFHCRERFYAGREAGWGAQVMEQPITGITTFNDVDLSADELMGDFSHDGLSERDALGTVGLWCGLHGESFLQAGMHHLEAQFDFDALTQQLAAEEGVKTMKPFTNFSYLRQAFTEGERWQVDSTRIESLVKRNLITPQQAENFREQGAIGSHLENLERNDGFKGFNQTGVSEIIAATDPRKQNMPARV
ncbi:MAG TPA: hypothetical protein VF669_04130 [Tepidisphaeraceae bacterium]